MNIRYRTGGWQAAVSEQGIALLPADVDLVLVEGIWGRVARGAGLGGVLEALTGAFGTSLSMIPSFGVAILADDEVRLAVRGPLAVRVQTKDAATVVISGLGVTTWSERVITDAAAVEVVLDDAEDTGAWYPLGDGIVPASAVRLTLAAVVSGPIAVEPDADSGADADAAEADASVGAAPEPEPVAEPEPEPALEPVTKPEPAAEPEPAHSPEPAHLHPAPEDTWIPVAGETMGEPTALEDPFDPLWGATVLNPQASASPPPLPEPIARPGDHDGETITHAQMQALRATSGAGVSGAVAPGTVGATGAAVSAASGEGWLELSTGDRVELDRPVVIGRRPRAVRVTGALPHLVAVPSPQQDISRSHLEVRREGDATLVIDLDTTNGTVLHRAGTVPVRLHPNDPTILIEGDVIDLGDGVTATVRGIG